MIKNLLQSLFLILIGVGAVSSACAIMYFAKLLNVDTSIENNIKFAICAVVGIICVIISLVVFNIDGSEVENGSGSENDKE